MLMEVANANASAVCPEGNEGLPPSATFCKYGQVTNGLGLLMLYFNAVAINADESKDAPICKLFCFARESFLIKPIPNKITGIPYAIGEAEFEMPLKVSSKEVFLCR